MSKIKQATIDNIQRIDRIVTNAYSKCDCCDIPLPALIELSLIDYCNRKCIFCPKSNDNIAPNQKHLYMSVDLIKKITNDLLNMKFKGIIILAGYGEPLLSPIFLDAVRILASNNKVEAVTNGDFLTKKSITEMIDAGISFISVSIYSNEERYAAVKYMFDELDIHNSRYIIRDRWYTDTEDYGVKLTNRAGVISIGNQPEVNRETKCYYPFYSITVDWNGDVFLCPQDWNRRIKTGNIAFTSIHDIWVGNAYKKYRESLYSGKRIHLPCVNCNAEGACHGKLYADNF